VTHRLLGFSRRLGPGIEPVDVAQALDETVGFVAKEAESMHIRLVRSYDPDVPTIRSSLARMQQVFLNLLNNALDAVGREGEVRLSVRRFDDGVEVTVADNGPGIPVAMRERVFEPFFSTKTNSPRNAGLGLAICRETMAGLGGTVTIDSTEGQGTTFRLRFPIAPPSEPSARPPA
jgi:two-component system NtrC family sensor kinase